MRQGGEDFAESMPFCIFCPENSYSRKSRETVMGTERMLF
ncbi:hypothetical protein HMPREF9141_2659 [Prevotella multiformis DSM 16608]|uniref:Uncharacterized protein n=1 Tax=Prevotella multiformis DSM 16608 TaxID=888743 RepID=F0FAP2_9BACT|nr:hypothetical protein HMPREF9141_2659 [Prevotella multiformis DSM 16608]